MEKNYLTAAMYGLEDLVLASSTFCAAIEDNPSQEFIRENHIHWGLVEHDPWRSKAKRPLALLNDTEAMSWDPDSESYGSQLSASGSIELMLAADTVYPTDHTRSLKAFQAWAGHVVQDIAAKAGTGNYYPFAPIRHATQCHRSPRDQDKTHDYFWVLVECRFGSGGG